MNKDFTNDLASVEMDNKKYKIYVEKPLQTLEQPLITINSLLKCKLPASEKLAEISRLITKFVVLVPCHLAKQFPEGCEGLQISESNDEPPEACKECENYLYKED